MGSCHYRNRTKISGALATIGVAVLFLVWFVAFPSALAVVTKDRESTVVCANLLQFPLLFSSGAFLLLDVLPGWIRRFAWFNAATQGVDTARAIILDTDVMSVIEVSRLGRAARYHRPRRRPGGSGARA